MDKSELPFLSASELSRLIASGEVSPVEAAESYLDRIDSLDFKFNAYLTVTREMAMDAARQAEQEIAAGNHRGPMHGVPVAVKDQFHSSGVRTTGGSRILADFVPDEDATVIANLKQAGAVLLGKTNLTEFAITGFSHRFSTPAQSVGPERLRRRLQQRLRGSHRGVPLRHVAGRGYRRLHSLSCYLVRTGRSAAHLGAGQPLRSNAGRLVNGHRRPNLPHGGRRSYHAERHRGPRPQGRAHLDRAPCLIIGPLWAAALRACVSVS